VLALSIILLYDAECDLFFPVKHTHSFIRTFIMCTMSNYFCTHGKHQRSSSWAPANSSTPACIAKTVHWCTCMDVGFSRWGFLI